MQRYYYLRKQHRHGELKKKSSLGCIMKHLSIGLVLIMALASFSGCLADEIQKEEVMIPENDFRTYSVVAPVDTGINVYHDHFRTNETFPDWLIEGLGVTMTCELTFEGTWQERYEADKELSLIHI